MDAKAQSTSADPWRESPQWQQGRVALLRMMWDVPLLRSLRRSSAVPLPFTPDYSRHRQIFGESARLPSLLNPIEAVKKSWDRLPACHFSRISDRLEAYPTQ